MPEPKTKPKPDAYEGPFETQEEEDAAYSRYTRLRERRAAELEEKRKTEEEANKGKRGKLLPIVE